MKKSLLLAALAVAGTSAFAAVDPATYTNVPGFEIKNMWLTSLNNDEDGFKALIGAYPNYARTATMLDGKVYIASSRMDNAAEPGTSIDNGSLIVCDMMTGEHLKTMQLTVDGEPLYGLLCANTVDVDDFGHLYVAGYYASTYVQPEGEDAYVRQMKLYTVNPETGACTLAATVAVGEDEAAESNARIDYFDVVGDITRKEAGCVIMTNSSGAAAPYIYGWQAEQGSDEFGPHMNDGEYYSLAIDNTTPEGVTDWGTGPMVRICADDEYTGNLFYSDGSNTIPVLYSTEGAVISSMGSADKELWPATGCNGACEIKIGEQWFFAYPEGQYDAPHCCQIYINTVGADQSFDSMAKGYLIPEAGLGQVSDGGNRIHCIQAQMATDAAGKEAAYILTYKCANGVGIYRVAQEGFQSGVQAVEVENNDAVEYFNLQGIRVDASNAGLYIRRQGNTATKVLVK